MWGKIEELLESLVENKEIKCKQKNIDKYKRIIATCYIDEINLNKEMVKSGWAIAYRYYSKKYINDELFAQKNKLGMWQGSFIEPRKWRKNTKNENTIYSRLVYFVLTLAISSPCLSKWKKLEEGDEYIKYYDIDTVKKIDGIVYIWSMKDFKKSQKMEILVLNIIQSMIVI